jgi:hypothetical protein
MLFREHHIVLGITTYGLFREHHIVLGITTYITFREHHIVSGIVLHIESAVPLKIVDQISLLLLLLLYHLCSHHCGYIL